MGQAAGLEAAVGGLMLGAWLKGPGLAAGSEGHAGQLRVGQAGRIVALVGKGPLVQRLYEMGLLEGEEVLLVRKAPLGDPLELRVMGYALSLRQGEAERVRVVGL